MPPPASRRAGTWGLPATSGPPLAGPLEPTPRHARSVGPCGRHPLPLVGLGPGLHSLMLAGILGQGTKSPRHVALGFVGFGVDARLMGH